MPPADATPGSAARASASSDTARGAPGAPGALAGAAVRSSAAPLHPDPPHHPPAPAPSRPEPRADHDAPPRAVEHRRHSVAWLVWALAGAVSVQLAPNPLYALLVVGIAALVVEVHAPPGPYARAFPVLVALGVAFAAVRVVLAAATTHTGLGGTVLFTTPSLTLPGALGGFTVGGPVELAVILQVAAEGMTIVAIMAVFGAFNAVVSHHELIGAAPRAFHEVGLIVVVALAFVPSTIESVQAVREADRARTGGRAVRRGRLTRQVVPVLERGLERALALAESMDSRGYGASPPGDRDRAAAWCGLVGVVALGGALVALVGRARPVAALLAAGGAVAIAAAVALASRARGGSRYRPRRLTRADAVTMAVSLAAPVAVALLAARDERSLTWSATPLAWPAFSPLVALALAALLAPLLPGRES